MGYVPPPSGVFGCGNSTIARPGVKIWPLIAVKLVFWGDEVERTPHA